MDPRLILLAFVVVASPNPFATPNVHPFRHPNFAGYAARDPSLVRDRQISAISGLRAYRSRDRPSVVGYLEPSEGRIGRCGTKFYAAVPLDSGSAAGFAGWLLYYPGIPRHVAVVPATAGLDFHAGRLRASNLIYDSRSDAVSPVRRVDSYTCRAGRLRLVGTRLSAAR